MIVLGIETSCDETAIAIIKKEPDKISVLANIVSSQISLHAQFGGVVPNLAAREHLKNIIPVFKSALQEANLKPDEIDLISVTNGPGLIPALLIGTSFAKTLSFSFNKTLLGIHHIEGHIFANFIENSSKIEFPALALVVSGGHTQLVLVNDLFKYQVIGETKDDAVGEAFDKVARLLGLSYPGGPIISQMADQYLKGKPGYKGEFFPRPMMKSDDLNFSFSGLKTAVLYAVKKFREEKSLKENEALPDEFIQRISFEFQEAATDVLVYKTLKAGIANNVKTIFLAGGVSANKSLRDKLSTVIKREYPQAEFILQPVAYSTDNATMIAVAGAYRWEKMSPQEKGDALKNWQTIQTKAQIKLK